MLGFRFSYLYKLHSESFMGLNLVCLPGSNPPGAVYRSSLPATPVSTPIRENGRFSEQALRERLCRTPSPRKCRLFESRVSEPDLGLNILQPSFQLGLSPDDDDDKSDDSDSSATITQPKEQQVTENIETKPLSRRIFVGNISYRVTREQLKKFFSQFGKVTDCVIVQDHIRRRPRGYGFITFAKGEDAEKVRNLSPEYFELDSRRLRIFPADDKRTAKLRQEAKQILYQDVAEDETDSVEPTMVEVQVNTRIDNINDLPDDVLMMIYSYLEIIDRVRVERVCKRWRLLSLKKWQSQHSLHFRNVFSLFKGCPLTNTVLTSLLRKCSSHLRDLDLGTASHVLDYRALEVIAQFCPNLENIDISSVKTTNVSLHQLAKKCPNLKKVVLQRCLEVGENGLWWLLHLCKGLEYLDVTGNVRLTGQCFHMAGPNMQVLILNGCTKFSPVGFTKIATRCCHLSSLHLNNCSQLTDGALELICQSLKDLKIFHLEGSFRKLTASGLHHIGRLSNLEELSLAHNRAVDDDIIYSISHGCRKIKFLNITECHLGVTDASLSALSSCIHLRKLYISYLDKVTNDGLSSLARQGQLEVLQCRGCPNLGDTGFVTLILLSANLKSLDVSGCHLVTNTTIQACMDNIYGRASDEKLTIVVGDTSADLDTLDIDDPSLIVCGMSYCQNRLRPDRMDFMGQESPDLDEFSDSDEDEPELPQGAHEGSQSWHVTEEMFQDFMVNDDPAAVNEWEAPF